MIIVVACLAGVLSWSVTEYVLHRFDGHGMKGKTPFSREHLRHHAETTYFAPWWKKLALAVALLGVVTPGVALVAGWAFAVPYTAVFIGTWLTYEWIHRRIHTHAPKTAYGRWVRRHHLLHHHRAPKDNHGVTSPIWDLVFQTWDRTHQVVIPARQAPDWLVDANGDVYAAFAADYLVKGRAPVARDASLAS